MELTGYKIIVAAVNNCLCYPPHTVFTGVGKGVLPPPDMPLCMGLAEGLTTALAVCSHSDKPAMEFQCTGGYDGCPGQLTYRIEKPDPNESAGTKSKAVAINRQFGAISKLLLNLPMFKSFDQKSMADLLSHFQFEHIHDLGFRSYKYQDVIISKGQAGTHLYIIVAGKVAVVDERGNTITFLCNGEVFGEMSLISGNPVGATVKAVSPTTVFRLDSKDFARILSKFPALQFYFTNLLSQRLAQSNQERTRDLSTGMAGNLVEIPAEDVLQTLNVNMKTGALNFRLDKGDAVIYLRQGEIIHAKFNQYTDMEAIRKILATRTGKFNFIPHLPPETDHMKPLGNFMGILMNTLKELDERGGIL